MMHDERHDDVLAKLSSSSSGYYSFDVRAVMLNSFSEYVVRNKCCACLEI